MARRTKRSDERYAVNIRIEQADGTRRRVYFYGRTQAEARAKAEQAQARVAAGGSVRDATQPLSAWLAESWDQEDLCQRPPECSTNEADEQIAERGTRGGTQSINLNCAAICLDL